MPLGICSCFPVENKDAYQDHIPTGVYLVEAPFGVVS